MNDTLLRIRQVFHESEKSQTEIGKAISKTSQYVWKLLNDDSANPSDSVIKDICREFNVNEDWIRYGRGHQYISSDDKLMEYISEISLGNDDFIKDLIMVYMELDDISKEALKKLADGMLKRHQERDQN